MAWHRDRHGEHWSQPTLPWLKECFLLKVTDNKMWPNFGIVPYTLSSGGLHKCNSNLKRSTFSVWDRAVLPRNMVAFFFNEFSGRWWRHPLEFRMNEHSPWDPLSTCGFFSNARKTRKQFLKLRFGWITWNKWPSSIYRLIASLSDLSRGFIHPWLAGYLPSTVGICIPITSYKDDPPSEAKHLPWTNVTAKSCCYRVMLHAAEGVGRAMAGSKAGWFHPQMVKDQGNPNLQCPKEFRF